VAGDARSPEDISAEIAQTRTRLAGTVDQLVYRANPKTIAKREVSSVRSRFVGPDGKPKVDAIAKTAAVIVGIVTAVAVLRKIVG
jgi:Protein of unknown function (DUF3618)